MGKNDLIDRNRHHNSLQGRKDHGEEREKRLGLRREKQRKGRIATSQSPLRTGAIIRVAEGNGVERKVSAWLNEMRRR